jgi:succinylglutamic semialdehyde dehydrogenase
MGGKNAALVFDDANIKQAAMDCARSALMTSGQRCNALSRVIVQASVVQDFIKELLEAVLRWRIGYFQNPSSQMGPLVSAAALKRFLRYQKLARKEGARLILHGHRQKREHAGYYVSPAIHHMEENRPSRHQVGYRYDEIFGPDIAIYSFDRLEQAIRLHNDSRYGLIASVFTKRKAVFDELYRYLEVGNLHWNRPTVGTSPLLPFGGVKASGNHFPAGFFSPYYCTYPVAVQI